MRFGWLVAALLPGRGDASLARHADDLFGPAAVALLQPLVPRRRPVHHRCLAVAACSRSASACRSGASSTASEWRRLPQVGDRDHARLHRRQPAHHRSGQCRGARLGGRSRGEAIFASPPPVAFWRRDLVWREGGCYRRSRYDPLARRLRPGQRNASRPTWTTRSCARRSAAIPSCRSSSNGRSFRRPRSMREGCSAQVAIGDARYGEGRRSRLAREAVIADRRAGMRAKPRQYVRPVHNCAVMSSRGAHLVHGDRGFTTGGGLVARIIAPGVRGVLDRIDRHLERGGIDATLPDGSRRRLGFRNPGPAARIELRSWMALVRLGDVGLGRLVQGVGAWRMGVARTRCLCSSCSAPMPFRSASSAAPRDLLAG